MRTNFYGLDLIKTFEGLRLEAYLCPAGKWTIGYGRARGVHEGDTITKAQADAMLEDDLEVFEEGVRSALHGAPATDNQFSAMVCLAYNIGLGNFLKSAVLRDHKAAHYPLAANDFLNWRKVNGEVCHGLERRRLAERDLYLRG